MEENLEVIYKNDVATLQEMAGDTIGKLLFESDQDNEPSLLLVSGGSAFSMLDSIDLTGDLLPLTIGVLDERASKDEKVNNFSQLKNIHFFKYAVERGAEEIDTSNEEDPEVLAKAMQKAIKQWKGENANGKVVVTMGIGDDGHTAGIFGNDDPSFKELFEGQEWVVGYDVGDKSEHKKRATVTNTFLRNEVDKAIIYVVGENKNDVFKRIMNKDGKLNELPAMILHEMAEAHIFTDIDIAS